MTKTLQYQKMRVCAYAVSLFCAIYGLTLRFQIDQSSTFAHQMGVAALAPATFMFFYMGIYMQRLGEAEDGYEDKTTVPAVTAVAMGMIMVACLIIAVVVKP